MTVERVGVSFEPELLEKFDKLLESRVTPTDQKPSVIWSKINY